MTTRIEGIEPVGASTPVTSARQSRDPLGLSRALATSRPARDAASADSVAAQPVDRLALVARSAQQTAVLQDTAGETLQRVHKIVSELQSLLNQGVAETRPPRDSLAERRYAALLSELGQLGHAASFQNPPIPTGIDLSRLAAEVPELTRAGLGAALQDVHAAQQELSHDREGTIRILELVTRRLPGSDLVSLAGLRQAREAAADTRDLVRRDSAAAVDAQRPATERSSRLLAG